jgi:AcrR family transcriptional regulator
MASSETAAAPSRRPGRPPRDETDAVTRHVVACATALFVRNGYAGTSIEAVAAMARASKNTIYRRFATKTRLFEAVVDGQMRALLPPLETVAPGKDAMATLRQLATLLVEAALDPATIALQRLVIAEAERFPEIAAISIERANKQAVAIVRSVLDRVRANGAPARSDTAFAAEQLVAALAYPPLVYALLGHREIEGADQVARHVDRVLEYFLKGWLAR